MHGSINIAAAFFKYMWPLLPPCIKGLIIVASLLKINFKKYFFLKIYLKLWIVIFRARVNALIQYYMDTTENNNKGKIKEQINSIKKKTLHLMSDKFSKMMYEN